MPKPRLVLPRNQELPCEFDLRGLGQDPIFTHGWPISVLLVHGKDLSKCQDIARKMGFDCIEMPKHNVLAFHNPSARENGHKVDAVDLLCFVLRSAHLLHSSSSLHLLEVNQLFENLKAAGEGKIFDRNKYLEDQAAVPTWKNKRGLHLHPSVSHYLAQAGFQISPAVDQQFLSWSSLLSIRAKVISEIFASAEAESEVKRRRVE